MSKTKKKSVKKKAKKKTKPRSRSTRSAAGPSKEEQTPLKTKTKPASTGGPKITPVPTAGKKVLDFEKALDELIANDEELEKNLREISDGPAKKTRGRPRKIETEPAPGLTQKANPLWVPVLKIPFDVWAENQNIEELRITEKEAELLALPVTQLIDYYLPHLPEIAIAWFGLISAGYTILGPRRQIIMQRRQNKGTPGPSPNPPQGGGLFTKQAEQPAGFPNTDDVLNTEKI